MHSKRSPMPSRWAVNLARQWASNVNARAPDRCTYRTDARRSVRRTRARGLIRESCRSWETRARRSINATEPYSPPPYGFPGGSDRWHERHTSECCDAGRGHSTIVE